MDWTNNKLDFELMRKWVNQASLETNKKLI